MNERSQLASWKVCLIVAAVTFAVFAPSLASGFVRWDDEQNFLENASYRGLGPSNLAWMFTHFHLGHYQPLAWVTLGLDYAIWGMKPLGYHLTNVLLHALSAGVFCWLAAWFYRESTSLRLADAVEDRRLPPSARKTVRSAETERAAAFWFGALVALAWSLHPLRVEAVSWVTQRREVLCGLFTLLALGSHVQGRSRLLTAALALAAMLSKVTAVTIPVVLVIVDCWRASRSGVRITPGAIGKIAVRHAHLFLFAAILTVVAVMAQREATALATIKALPISSRLALYFFGAAFLFGKTFWPSGLAPLYQGQIGATTWVLKPFVWWVAAGGFVLVATFVAVAWRRRRRSLAFACWLAALLVLIAPAGGLTQSGPQTAADRYTYQAGWALTLAIGFAAAAMLRQRRAGWWEGVAGVILLTLAALTIRQQRFWRDTEALWNREVAVFPDNPIANYNLGLHYYRSETPDVVRAESHFRTAIASDPDYLEARVGLGFLLRAVGRTPEALAVLGDVVRARPDRMKSDALALGSALQWENGKRAEAIATLAAIVERDPRNPEAYRQLARAQAAVGRPTEAIATFERGIGATSGAVHPARRPRVAARDESGCRNPRRKARARARRKGRPERRDHDAVHEHHGGGVRRGGGVRAGRRDGRGGPREAAAGEGGGVAEAARKHGSQGADPGRAAVSVMGRLRRTCGAERRASPCSEKQTD